MISLILNIINIALKCLVALILLFLIEKVVGKKHMAQLTFFDYVVGIVTGSIAGSFSTNESESYVNCITALTVWGLIAYIVSFISMKSMHARRFFDSIPTILMQDGKIIYQNLKKEKINVNDFLEELRIKNVFNVSDVESAILETDGQLSVLLKSNKRPLTPEDLQMPTQYQGLSANLIIDGNIMSQNLSLVNLDQKWLLDELSKRGISSEKDVLLASLDTSGSLYIALKQDPPGSNTRTILE